MNMNDIDEYRAQKDYFMRNGNDVLVKDNFGGMQGIDPDAHGAELQ